MTTVTGIDRRRRSRGFSMAELLTVVTIIGIASLVSLPAIFQLMPQYRAKSSAAEMSSTMRMARQKAMATRTQWKVFFDVTNERYSLATLTGADPATTSHWRNVDASGQWLAAGAGPSWRTLAAIDLRNGTAPFNDVDGDGFRDLIFTREGFVSTAPPSGGGPALSFATPPSVILAVSSRLVAFNRYTITAGQRGTIAVRASKV